MGNNLGPGEHSPEFEFSSRTRAPPAPPAPPAYKIPSNLVLPSEIPTKPLKRVQKPRTISEADGWMTDEELQNVYDGKNIDAYRDVYFQKVYQTYRQNGGEPQADVKFAADSTGISRNANGAIRARGEANVAGRKKYRAPPPPSGKSPAPKRPPPPRANSRTYENPTLLKENVATSSNLKNVERLKDYGYETPNRDYFRPETAHNRSDIRQNVQPVPRPPPLDGPTAAQLQNHNVFQSPQSFTVNNESPKINSTTNKSRDSRKLSADLQSEILEAVKTRSRRPSVVVAPKPKVSTDPHDLFREELAQACRGKDKRKSSDQIDDHVKLFKNKTLIEKLETVKQQLAEIKGKRAEKSSEKTPGDIHDANNVEMNGKHEQRKQNLISETPKDAEVTSSKTSSADNGELGTVINLIDIAKPAAKPTVTDHRDEPDNDWTPDDVLQKLDDDISYGEERADYERYSQPHTPRSNSVEEVMYTPGVKIKTAEASFGSLRHCRSKSQESMVSEGGASTTSKRKSSVSKAASSLRALKRSVKNAFNSLGKGTLGSKERRSVRGVFSSGDGSDSESRSRRVQFATPHDHRYHPHSDVDNYYYNHRAIPAHVPGVMIDKIYKSIPVHLANEGQVIYGQPPRPVMYPMTSDYPYEYFLPPAAAVQYGHRPYVNANRQFIMPAEDGGRSDRHRRRHRRKPDDQEIYHRKMKSRSDPNYVHNWNSLKHDIQYDRGFPSSRISSFSSGSEEYEEYLTDRAGAEWVDDSEPDYLRATDTRRQQNTPVSSRRAKHQQHSAPDGHYIRNQRRKYRQRTISADENKNLPRTPNLSRSVPETLHIEPELAVPQKEPRSADPVTGNNRSTVFAYSNSLMRAMANNDKPVLQVLPTNLTIESTNNVNIEPALAPARDANTFREYLSNGQVLPPADYAAANTRQIAAGNGNLYSKNYRPIRYSPPISQHNIKQEPWNEDLVAL
ncbi:uncharacterized protein LOC141912770 [Tubulanus polymorphus]|uniref:uncharacterized protein LOC141912770 n=1 Tax=Tubulanus polymorphus TaxID=672921 RepID=UPI003DA334B2